LNDIIPHYDPNHQPNDSYCANYVPIPSDDASASKLLHQEVIAIAVAVTIAFCLAVLILILRLVYRFILLLHVVIAV